MVTTERIEELESNADQYWNAFYNIHQNKFFKDRNWLFIEFPELDPSKTSKTGLTRIFEIGSGVGNTIFPILRTVSPEQEIFVFASDFSENAINILKESPEYDGKRCQAFVLDAAQEYWNVPFEDGSIDVVVLIFVLSAINPEK